MSQWKSYPSHQKKTPKTLLKSQENILKKLHAGPRLRLVGEVTTRVRLIERLACACFHGNCDVSPGEKTVEMSG